MFARTAPSYQRYSHATPPDRTYEVYVSDEVSASVPPPPGTMNGVASQCQAQSMSPETPAAERLGSSRSAHTVVIESQPHTPPPSTIQGTRPVFAGTLTPSKEKRKYSEDMSTPTSQNKRSRLSLNNRSRSHTSSCHSHCLSGRILPLGGSSSSCSASAVSQRTESVSSPDPPLTPVNGEGNSRLQVSSVESPTTLVLDDTWAVKYDESVPLVTEPESPLSGVQKNQQTSKWFVDKRERVAMSSPQPLTSHQALSMEATNPLDVAPSSYREDGKLTHENDDEENEVRIEPPRPRFHDISSWGEGRLVHGCDIAHAKPFDKFSQGHLQNYVELVSKEGDRENYLYTVERLINLGWFFPTSKLAESFRFMWNCESEHVVKKMHLLLEQDVALRTDTCMTSSRLWYQIGNCLEAIKSNSKVLLASVLLSYLLKFLIKNLDSNKLDPKASLVHLVLSSKKTLNITRVLETIFLYLERERSLSPVTVGVECPVQTLLTMLCLPLLTSDPSTLPELRTKLAREISSQVDQIRPYSLQHELIAVIPSNFLKEKVLDFVLERNFSLPSELSATARTFSDSSVSFAKIASVHLYREVRHQHRLSFFLQLLTSLVQSHIVSVSGNQPLVSIVPSSPPQPLPDEFSTSITMDDTRLRSALLDLHAGVLQLTDRLSQGKHFVEVAEPCNWFYLQLLSLITSGR